MTKAKDADKKRRIRKLNLILDRLRKNLKKQAIAARDRRLAERIQAGDKQAAWELAMLYRDFTMARANLYSYGSNSAEDIEQEAVIGTHAAALRFDPDRAGFPTAAKQNIRNAMRPFKEGAYPVRIPSHALQYYNRLQADKELDDADRNTATLGACIVEGQFLSLSQPTTDGDTPLESIVSNTDTFTVEHNMFNDLHYRNSLKSRRMRRALSLMNRTDRIIIEGSLVMNLDMQEIHCVLVRRGLASGKYDRLWGKRNHQRVFKKLQKMCGLIDLAKDQEQADLIADENSLSQDVSVMLKRLEFLELSKSPIMRQALSNMSPVDQIIVRGYYLQGLCMERIHAELQNQGLISEPHTTKWAINSLNAVKTKLKKLTTIIREVENREIAMRLTTEEATRNYSARELLQRVDYLSIMNQPRVRRILARLDRETRIMIEGYYVMCLKMEQIHAALRNRGLTDEPFDNNWSQRALHRLNKIVNRLITRCQTITNDEHFKLLTTNNGLELNDKQLRDRINFLSVADTEKGNRAFALLPIKYRVVLNGHYRQNLKLEEIHAELQRRGLTQNDFRAKAMKSFKDKARNRFHELASRID